MQDIRNWGNQRQLVANEANAVSIHQAWGEVELVKGLSLKAGRMELAYDDHRILGNVGWAQNEQTFDAITLQNKGLSNIRLT